MGIEQFIEFYVNGWQEIFIIGAVMELIRRIDSGMDSWSLSDKFKVFGAELSWMNVIGATLSLGAALFLTLTAGMFWFYFIPGALAIYMTEYAVAKMGWKNVIEILKFVGDILKRVAQKG